MTQCVADETLGRFARQQHDVFERVRKGSLDPEAVMRAIQAIIDKVYPAIGEVFELKLNADDPANDPIQMVRSNGYSNSENWKFTGSRLACVITRHFKLVQIGYCKDWGEVQQKLKKHGRLPEGQWREAFKAKYPMPDGNGPIGVPDSSWVRPNGYQHFPSVSTDGTSLFRWTDDDFFDSWRWLVEVSE